MKNLIEVLIFGVLWIVGAILLIMGISLEDSMYMSIGAILLIIYGITPTISFIFGIAFDIFANNPDNVNGFFLALVINIVLIIILTPTGIVLMIYPIAAIIKMLEKLLYGTNDINDEFCTSRRFTMAAIAGIFSATTTFALGQTLIPMIDKLFGVNLYTDCNLLFNFINTFPFMSGIIILILSIRIGYKWGSFGG